MPNSRARRSDGFYFVVVDGYCQWQELKDYLRDFAKVRPGHTNVVKVNEDGTRVGFCPLPNKAEANRAFDYLVAEGWRGLNIRVSLVWKSDLSSDEIERRRGPEQSRRRRLPPSTPMLPYPSNASHPTRSLPTVMVRDASPMNTTFHPTYVTNKLSPMAIPVTPNYMLYNRIDHDVSQTVMQSSMNYNHYNPDATNNYSHSSMWSNLQDLRYVDAPPTPSLSIQQCSQTGDHDYRSIFISQLPQDVKREELIRLLQEYGSVSDLDVRNISGERTFAIVRFKNRADAASALRDLDGRKWRKRKLVIGYTGAGFDSLSFGYTLSSKASDSDSSGAQVPPAGSRAQSGPLVVNGAMGPGYHRRRKKDDDSESMRSLEGTNTPDEQGRRGAAKRDTVQ